MKLRHLICSIIAAVCVIPQGSPPSEAGIRIVGACFPIHGRLSCYNGSPCFRIWKIGTHRVFGVEDDDSENPKFPENLARVHPSFGTVIDGDFRLCPLTKSRPGWMQMVTIRSANNLVVQRYTDP
jgi:hypothetical protein